MRTYIVAAVLATLWTGTVVAEGAALRSIVIGGGTLPESVRQETIAATDRAIRHLAAKQSDNGQWTDLTQPDADRVALSLKVSPIKESKDAFNRYIDNLPPLEQPANPTQRISSLTARASLLAAAGSTNQAWSLVDQLADLQTKTGPTPLHGAFLMTTNAPNQVAKPLQQLRIAETLWTLDALTPRPPQPDNGIDQEAFTAYLTQLPTQKAEIVLAHALMAPHTPLNEKTVDHSLDQLKAARTETMSYEQLRILVTILSAAPPAPDHWIALDNGSRMNWKEYVASRVVAHQKINPKHGYGFWNAQMAQKDIGRDLIATANAIRILAEL